MRKYLHVINIGFQNNLQYRTNYLARTLFGFIPLFAMLSLWRSIYEGDSTLGERNGFTEAQMIFYYLLVAVVDLFAAVNDDDWQIAADIREGNINHFLLKPMDYLGYRLCLFFSGRLDYISMACIPLGVFIFCFRGHFVAPVDSTAMLVFPIAVLMTALLQFFISYTMAMLAFWFLEISTFIFIVFAFEYVASGHLFPLDLLPPVVKQILFFTPFPYELYFPVSVYMGKVQGAELWQGLMMQLFWVLTAFATARFMWARGVRKYSAFGG